MKLTIMRGVSGSGKSTLAKAIAEETGAKIVSRDDIRFGLFQTEFDPEIEDEITLIERSIISGYLKAGYDVISDNTYIDMKHLDAMAKFGFKHGAEVEVKVVDVPLKVAKRNNDHRAMLGGRHVPHEVIEKMHAAFQSSKNTPLMVLPEIIPYTGTPHMPKAFLFDLDGTVYHMNGKRGPYDHNVDVDDPDPVIQAVVNSLSTSYLPIAMSGRKNATRKNTLRAMNRDGLHAHQLFMRADDDNRPDNIIKYELFDKYVRDFYDVQFVLDDRQQVVDMWRRLGLKCLQVQEGDF